MKKLLFICCLILVGINHQVSASVGLGSEITYGTTAPGIWDVAYKLIQDCSTTAAPATLSLEIGAPGCTASRTVILYPVGNNTTVASPYCANSSLTYCGGAGTATIYTYTALVTFTNPEANCTNGIYLRVYGPNLQRAATANITGTHTFYNETFLNFSTVKIPNGNQSPQLAPGKNLLTTFTANSQVDFNVSAVDFASDSLAYHLAPALQGSNTPVTYQAGLSSQLPFPSVTGVTLDPVTGNLKFTAPAYVSGPSGALSQANNRYTVVLEVKEYQKITGAMTHLGSTRFEMMFEIEPATGNILPQLANFTLNGQPFFPDQPLSIPVGRQSIIHFETVDGDAWDQLTLFLFQNRNPASMNVVQTSGARPEVTITWTPTAADMQRSSFNFSMKVEDNSCPIKGVTYKNLEIRVANPTGLSPALEPDLKFNVFPNPFQDDVTFQVESTNAANPAIVIYNVLGQEVDRIQVINTTRQEIKWNHAGKFPAGQYLAKLVTKEKESQLVKFIKLP